jgi:hypothetical protein
VNDPSDDADGGSRAGGDSEFGWKALYRDWASSVHDMVGAWALQRGVDLVAFSAPDGGRKEQ